jgi:hypothetical protein
VYKLASNGILPNSGFSSSHVSAEKHPLAMPELFQGFLKFLSRPPGWVSLRELRLDLDHKREVVEQHNRVGEFTLAPAFRRVSVNEVQKKCMLEKPLDKCFVIFAGVSARLGRGRHCES